MLLAAAVLPFHGLAVRVGPVGLRPFETVLALALLASLPTAAREWRCWLRRRAFDREVLAVVLLGALALVLHPGPGESARVFRLVIAEPVLFYLLATRLHPRAEPLVWALVAGAVAAGLHGFVQLATGLGPIEAEGVDRIRGPYSSPNNLGLLLDRVVPLALALALARPRLPRIAAAVVLLAALALTYSVGAWLATGAGLALVLWRLGHRRALMALAGAALIGALVVVLLRPERVFSPTTTSIRVLLWGSSIEMLRDHLPTGVGLDNFLYLYSPDHAERPYMHTEAWREPNLSHPHNLLLDWWLSLGLPGALLLGWVLLRYARLARRARTALGIALTASFLAGLLHGLIDNSFFLVDLAALWWLTLGYLEEG